LDSASNRQDGLKYPTAAEWAAFAEALPTGEHCPKGLLCLGRTHAQPKNNAVPVFRRMLSSHQRSLNAATGYNELAGQIAARGLELVRIQTALQWASELSDDLAAAIEAHA